MEIAQYPFPIFSRLFLLQLFIINRPGVAGAVLQTPSVLNNWLTNSVSHLLGKYLEDTYTPNLVELGSLNFKAGVYFINHWVPVAIPPFFEVHRTDTVQHSFWPVHSLFTFQFLVNSVNSKEWSVKGSLWRLLSILSALFSCPFLLQLLWQQLLCYMLQLQRKLALDHEIVAPFISNT